MNNFVKERIRAKKDVTGIWSIIPSAMVTEIIASSGLDFIILDMEHGAFDVDLLNESIRAAVSQNCSPIIRVPSIDQVLIQRVLDIGAHGIIAPQVRTADDAIRLLKATLFSPAGERGYNPYTRSGDYTGNHQSDYLQEGFPLISVIIENVEAYANLREIVAMPGIDVFYLGVYDMSCALGVRGQLNHRSVTDFVTEATRIIQDAGKSVGIMIDRLIPEMKVDKGTFYVLQPDTFQLKNSITSRIF